MRAESAVEPTRSENITVTRRRSALWWGLGSAGAAAGSDATGVGPARSRMAAETFFESMAKGDAEFLEALIC